MRFWRRAAVVAAVIVVAGSCTYAYADPDVTATCETFEFEINDHGLDPTGGTTSAIVGAVGRFADLARRDVNYLGVTTATHQTHAPDDPVLVELAWPEELASHLGYARPHVVDGAYTSGYVLVHPGMTVAPSGLVRRLVLHELGHLVGLADVTAPDELMDPSLPVDDYGPGDFFGIVTTHGGFCS